MADPEKTLDRGLSNYKEKEYSDEWKRVGISDSKDYAMLTNILSATAISKAKNPSDISESK